MGQTKTINVQSACLVVCATCLSSYLGSVCSVDFGAQQEDLTEPTQLQKGVMAYFSPANRILLLLTIAFPQLKCAQGCFCSHGADEKEMLVTVSGLVALQVGI